MPRFSLRCGLAVLCLGVAAFTACKPSDTAPTTTTKAEQTTAYDLRGVIERLGTDQAPRQLIIRHEATKDMDSMSMPFPIDAAVPLTGLSVGDKVSFRCVIDAHGEHVTKLEKLPANTALNLPGAPSTSTAPAAGTMNGMPGM